jgi:XTP/dITP diphosphohydrolase
MRLVLATRNAHKAREFAELLPGHEVVELPEAVVLPPETGETFAENALGKARAAAAATGMAAFADDSGIAVPMLGGEPGVRSARWAGENAGDADNLRLLLQRVPDGAALEYVCAIAFTDPANGDEQTFEGRCAGTMTTTPRGTGGFGYDPAFVPTDAASGRTMAELSVAEKDAISHRGHAARELLAWLTAR